MSKISGRMTVVEPAMQQSIPSKNSCIVPFGNIYGIVKIAPLNSTIGIIEMTYSVR